MWEKNPIHESVSYNFRAQTRFHSNHIYCIYICLPRAAIFLCWEMTYFKLLIWCILLWAKNHDTLSSKCHLHIQGSCVIKNVFLVVTLFPTSCQSKNCFPKGRYMHCVHLVLLGILLLYSALVPLNLPFDNHLCSFHLAKNILRPLCQMSCFVYTVNFSSENSVLHLHFYYAYNSTKNNE